jgi:hypothetical protein
MYSNRSHPLVSDIWFFIGALFALLFGISCPAYAQTLVWNETAPTAQEVQSYSYKLYVTPPGSNVSNAPLTLSSVTCTTTTPYECSSPVPGGSGATTAGATSQMTATAFVNGEAFESALSAAWVQPSATGCTYQGNSYTTGTVLVVTVNKNQVDSTQAAFLNGGWSITTRQNGGRYTITATC